MQQQPPYLIQSQFWLLKNVFCVRPTYLPILRMAQALTAFSWYIVNAIRNTNFNLIRWRDNAPFSTSRTSYKINVDPKRSDCYAGCKMLYLFSGANVPFPMYCLCSKRGMQNANSQLFGACLIVI